MLVPLRLPDVTLPVTDKLSNVPTDVILVCAAVVSVPTMLVPLRLPPTMLPTELISPAEIKLPPFMLPVALTTPPVLTLPPTMLPLTLKLVNVPSEVMLAWAASVTVAAVPDTFPVTLITYVPLKRSELTVPDVSALALILLVNNVPMLAIPVVKILPALTLPVALTLPAVLTLLPVTLPVADNNPVTSAPVVANTRILPTALTVAKILPLGPATAITVVPLVI